MPTADSCANGALSRHPLQAQTPMKNSLIRAAVPLVDGATLLRATIAGADPPPFGLRLGRNISHETWHCAWYKLIIFCLVGPAFLVHDAMFYSGTMMPPITSPPSPLSLAPTVHPPSCWLHPFRNYHNCSAPLEFELFLCSPRDCHHQQVRVFSPPCCS